MQFVRNITSEIIHTPDRLQDKIPVSGKKSYNPQITIPSNYSEFSTVKQRPSIKFSARLHLATPVT